MEAKRTEEAAAFAFPVAIGGKLEERFGSSGGALRRGGVDLELDEGKAMKAQR